MKSFKLVDTVVFFLCFVGGILVILNYSKVPMFIFASFWIVLLLAYIRILDYDAFFIVKDNETEDN